MQSKVLMLPKVIKSNKLSNLTLFVSSLYHLSQIFELRILFKKKKKNLDLGRSRPRPLFLCNHRRPKASVRKSQQKYKDLYGNFD